MEQEYLALYRLSHNKYLVEKTTDPTKSFQRHIDGIGGPYTQIYLPYVILDIIPVNSKDEFNQLVNTYIQQYGKTNVFIND